MIPAFLADIQNKKRKGDHNNGQRIDNSVGDRHSGDRDRKVSVDKEVLQSKGGSSPPPPASPREEATAQMELERARAQVEEEKAARAAAAAKAERDANVQKAINIQGQAYNNALDYGNQQVGARGFDRGLVDKYGLLNLYNSDINADKLGIAEDNLNPGAAYNTRTAFSNALDTSLGTYRGDLKKQLNGIASDGFSYDLFADTADDSILQSILDSQRADALSTIDASKARGQLNDVGYKRALKGLDDQGIAGMADLQDLGMGVLSGYRKDLDALRDNTLTDIGSADFSNPYGFDNFQKRLTDTTSSLNGRLQGDIFRATNGQTFFDPASIITTSGSLQGAFNPTGGTNSTAVANPLMDAFVSDEQKKKTAQSSNGVF